MFVKKNEIFPFFKNNYRNTGTYIETYWPVDCNYRTCDTDKNHLSQRYYRKEISYERIRRFPCTLN